MEVASKVIGAVMERRIVLMGLMSKDALGVTAPAASLLALMEVVFQILRNAMEHETVRTDQMKLVVLTAQMMSSSVVAHSCVFQKANYVIGQGTVPMERMNKPTAISMNAWIIMVIVNTSVLI